MRHTLAGIDGDPRRTPTHTRPHTQGRAHVFTPTTRARTYTSKHTYTHIDAHTHSKHTKPRSNTRTWAQTHACTCKRTHMLSNARTQAQTQKQKRKRRHTRANTSTCPGIVSVKWSIFWNKWRKLATKECSEV